jgi:hypothetical protein
MVGILPAMIRLILVVTCALALAACGAESVEPVTVPSTATTVAATTTTAVVATTTTTVFEEAPASTEPPPTTTTSVEPGVTALEFVVTNGEVADLRAALGDEVRITIRSDQVDEAHLHGYDIHADVGPDSPAVIEFVAGIPGIFEIEFESNGVLIAELRVDP